MNNDTLSLSAEAQKKIRLFYGQEITTKQELLKAVYLRIEEIVDEEVGEVAGEAQ